MLFHFISICTQQENTNHKGLLDGYVYIACFYDCTTQRITTKLCTAVTYRIWPRIFNVFVLMLNKNIYSCGKDEDLYTFTYNMKAHRKCIIFLWPLYNLKLLFCFCILFLFAATYYIAWNSNGKQICLPRAIIVQKQKALQRGFLLYAFMLYIMLNILAFTTIGKIQITKFRSSAILIIIVMKM